MTRMPRPLGPSVLCLAALGLSACPGPDDTGDGLDCSDPALHGTWEGDVGEGDVADLCEGWCTLEVTGSVLLDATQLTSLDGLSCVTRIGGDLTVRSNPDLASISGLAALTEVGGNVSIGEYLCEFTTEWVCTGYGNPALTSLDGLQNLESVGGWLWIADNDALVDPGVSFDTLATIGGAGGMSLLVDGHAALTRLPDLPLITSISGWNTIWGNESLVSLEGLPNLATVDGDLMIAYNPALPTLQGLESLETMTGTLYLVDNGTVTAGGLDGLTTVGGALEFWDNASLVSFEGLDQLTSIGLWMQNINNDALLDLSGLGGLTEIGAEFNIMGNDALQTVDGAWALTEIHGWLQICPYGEDLNDALTSLGGLYGLQAVDGNVVIRDNPILTNAEAWALVAEIETIGGKVTIADNE